MAKRISMIIAVNSAREDDLVIPLSSINNQLGIDFSNIEVILVDNGQYRLRDVEQFQLFKNLNIRYENPDTVLSWEEAFEHGVQCATGEYVMFMGPNGLLNQTSVIQSFSSTADQNPNAEVLTGLVLEQNIAKDRTTRFKVGNDFMSACGRWFKRTFLNQYGLHWRAVGRYSDELYSRLVNTVATNDVKVNEISYARFMSRDIRSDVLAPASQVTTTERITMLRQFLETVKRIDPQSYNDEFEKICVRYYTRRKEIANSDRALVDQSFYLLVAQNAVAWSNVQEFVNHLKLNNQAADAPWVKEQQLFDQYIQSLDKVANTSQFTQN
ncbi:glycosyltransferase family A protein [Secundilactobacillus hailunensis]|uniref:Glycosyltransferase family A protein n=1 Tax=Secundilactobacillus hailunensis TaxID=2559923 RepID=A0ABW1T531_9LACO|nr:glycosyltransferase family A protein [Secundilactobacillus hailunensis]